MGFRTEKIRELDLIDMTIAEEFQSFGMPDLRMISIARIRNFFDNFRTVISSDELSDTELVQTIACNFAIYGEEEIYNISSRAKNMLENNEQISDIFVSFKNAFKEALKEEIANNISNKSYINLFIEYLYAMHIKNGKL